ncbi:hypothetical protein [Amorphus orientalis]|uniref:Cysteine rich repeat-containing protein n=1 Tax=Amorphus orientalis TaxID=649198 RepID=A0AAE3VKY6_9HYPH|nr:hypothetical protein [Amorphus orientalis]MDQ0314074.1 hypothetical protein [Amorphus orientalis]
MIRVLAATAAIAVLTAGSAMAQSPELMESVRAACREDAERLCQSSDPTAVMGCLQAEESELSEGCRNVIREEELNVEDGND